MMAPSPLMMVAVMVSMVATPLLMTAVTSATPAQGLKDKEGVSKV